MAGHKRPFGQPICPDFNDPIDGTAKAASPPPEIDIVIPPIPPGGFYHYVNPNFVERDPPQNPPSQRPERAETPMTWVSTEPADEVPVKREPVFINEYHHRQTIRIERSHSVASSLTSTSSSYIRRIQQALTTSIPLASMFRTPRQDLSEVTRAARAEGLYTALVAQSRPRGGDGELSLSQQSWKVVIGQDAGTVAELADMYERDTVGTLGRHSVPPTSPLPPSMQSWVAQYTVKCMIGGVTLWVVLWAFFALV